MLDEKYISSLVAKELAEDIGTGDVTTELVVRPGTRAHGVIVAKMDGVVAGIDFAKVAFCHLSDDSVFVPHAKDGEKVGCGYAIAEVFGDAKAILSAERTALNFLGHLSGIATMTRKFVEAISDTKAKILDIPGLRLAEKYAVRCGGGNNHRFGLDDMILIKDNHIMAAGGIQNALENVFFKKSDDMKVEVEVDGLEQLQIALKFPVNIVMLDNFKIELVRMAIEMREKIGSNALFECSGGINLKNVREYAETGIEYISIGALTHSAPQMDVSLEFDLI